MSGRSDEWTLNLSPEDRLKMIRLDDKLFKENKNYLEDNDPMAKQVHDRILVLIKEKKFDSVEAISQTRMYDAVRQYYLAKKLFGF